MREMSIGGTIMRGRNESSSRRVSYWRVILVLCIGGSGICLLTGLVISLLTALGIMGASAFLADLTIAMLFGFLVLMFLAAHGMDRLFQEEKARREKEFRNRVLTTEEPRRQ